MQPTTSPPSPQHPPFRLIPSQVIRTQSEVSTIFTETPPPYAHQELEVVSLPQQLTTQQQLLQAQRLWKAMFRTSTGIPTTDSQRPKVENQRANSSWGDQLGEKQDGVTRLYGMNVNGLRLDKRGGQMDVFCKVLTEVQADVFCGQEHSLDSNISHVRQILYHTAMVKV